MNNQRKLNVTNLTLAGLFIALGLIIPYFAGHAFGVPGTVLLPMHIPVLMAGLLLGWRYGIAVGLVTPLLSSILTGMPPFLPVLPHMMVELTTYGFLTGLLRKKLKWPVYISLPTAMIIGRLMAAPFIFFILGLPNLTALQGVVIGNLLTGLPGIAIQLAFIPALVFFVENIFKRMGLYQEDSSRKTSSLIATNQNQEAKGVTMYKANQDAIERAIKAIEARECGCIIIKHNTIIHQGSGKGVKPLLDLLSSDEGRAQLDGAVVVDRIIGKAAAMLLVMAGASFAYGLTMSKSGEDFLKAHAIPLQYTRCVDAISDRSGRGICPMERSVMDIDDVHEAYEQILKTRDELMKNASAS